MTISEMRQEKDRILDVLDSVASLNSPDSLRGLYYDRTPTFCYIQGWENKLFLIIHQNIVMSENGRIYHHAIVEKILTEEEVKKIAVRQIFSQISEDEYKTVVNLINQKEKIRAIQTIRTRIPFGLLESKWTIEAIEDNCGKNTWVCHDDFEKAKYQIKTYTTG